MSKLVLAIAGAGLLAGCAGSGTAGTTPSSSPPEPGAMQAEAAGAARVMALPRQAGGEVALSLWIDAGSRDADPPQLATVAAFVAAERAGLTFDARVVPDGTEIHGVCPTSELARCIGDLARALGLRRVTPEQLGAARDRLVRRRRRAAADPGRRARQLALRALIGEASSGWMPLGAPEADPEVTAEAVEAHLEAHYGPSRALVAAVGELSPRALVRRVTDAFEPLPEAGRTRAARSPLEPRPGVAVEVGDAGRLVAATPVESTTQGATIARALAEGPLPNGWDGPRPVSLQAHAFDVRAASILLVHAGPVADLARAARELAFEVGRLRLEIPAPEGASPPPPEDPPSRLTRALGQQWVIESPGAGAGRTDPDAEDAGADDPDRAAPVVALGAVLDGGRGDRVKDGGDPDAPVRRGAEGRLAGALQQARAALHPKLRGAVHDDGASVVLQNGTRIAVRRRPRHRRVRITVRVEGGAAQDPASLHGRTALLATALTHGCDGSPPGALQVRLRELDADVRPVVAADAFGQVLEAPLRHWQPALELLLGCLTTPRLDPRTVDAGRLALLEALRRRPPFRAWAARALVPRVPGLLDPWGTPDTVAHVQRGDLTRARRRRVVGARLRLRIEGDVTPRDVVDRAARRLARLPSGALPAEPRPGPAAEGPVAAEWAGEGVAVLVGWRLPEGLPARAARGAARRLVAAFATGGGEGVLWVDAGTAGPVRWAAMAVRVTPESLDGVPERLDEALAGLVQAAEGDAPGLAGLAAATPSYVIARGEPD